VTETQVMLSPSKITAWNACDHYLTNELLKQRATSVSNRPWFIFNEIEPEEPSAAPVVYNLWGRIKRFGRDIWKITKKPFKPASSAIGLNKDSPQSELPNPPKSFQEMLQEKGNLHERKCLKAYQEVFTEGKVLKVPTPNNPDETWEQWIERIDEEENPWNGDYEIIFQMPFIHDGMRGIADFLIKREFTDSSGKKDFFYEPIDSKLARNNASKSHLLQLLFYAEALEERTGKKRAEQVYVALGKAIPPRELPDLVSFQVSHYWWYWIRKKSQLKEIISLPTKDLTDRTKPEMCSFCSFCNFFKGCTEKWGKDSLTNLAGSLKTHRDTLTAAGIDKIAKLALLPKQAIGENIRDFDEKTKQAFAEIEPKLIEKSDLISYEDLLHSWRDRDQSDDIDSSQLQKLWRQARLQSIRKENAQCPVCATGNTISEDDSLCPQCGLNLTKKRKIGKSYQFPPLHEQALAPIFLFNEQEIEEKVLKHFATMTDFQKKAQPHRVHESLLGLEEQSPYDVYLDFEGHPFWRVEEGIIFLFGYIKKDLHGWEYVQIWSHETDGEPTYEANGVPSKKAEKAAARKLINDLYERWQQSGRKMKVYHYNHTERTLLRDLTNEGDPNLNIQSMLQIISGSGMPENQSQIALRLNEMIREGVFVDLLNVVRISMQVGYESMSLKFMEKLTGFKRNENHDGNDGSGLAISAGAGAVFIYDLYANHADYNTERLDTPEELKKNLELIADYNKDDVEATRELHEWLLKQRQLTPDLPSYARKVEPEPPRESRGLHIMLQQRLAEHFRNLSNAN